MSFLIPPAAADVVEETHLRPEQVDREYLETDLLAEGAKRVSSKTDLVETKLLSAIARGDWDAQSDDDKARRGGILTDVIATLAQASLFGTAGFLRPAYWERSRELKQEAMDTLQAVLDELRRVYESVDEVGDPGEFEVIEFYGCV